MNGWSHSHTHTHTHTISVSQSCAITSDSHLPQTGRDVLLTHPSRALKIVYFPSWCCVQALCERHAFCSTYPHLSGENDKSVTWTKGCKNAPQLFWHATVRSSEIRRNKMKTQERSHGAIREDFFPLIFVFLHLFFIILTTRTWQSNNTVVVCDNIVLIYSSADRLIFIFYTETQMFPLEKVVTLFHFSAICSHMSG